MTIKKRRYSKTRTDIALVFCALIIIYTLVFRSESEIAAGVISTAFFSAGTLFGIYQGVGNLDLRALQKDKTGD
jgi:hypothetical protein